MQKRASERLSIRCFLVQKRASERALNRVFFGTKKEHPKMLYIPRVPSISAFSPASQAGRRPTAAYLSSPGENRGLDICIPTRNPFLNLWVKAQTNAHPRILPYPGQHCCRQLNYMRFRAECQYPAGQYQLVNFSR